MKRLIFFMLFTLFFPFLLPDSVFCGETARDQQEKEGNGVFIKVVESAEGEFEELSKQLQSAFKAIGWDVLAVYDSSVPVGCFFRSRVFVVNSSEYNEKILSKSNYNIFVIPLRASIYEDEKGINIAVLNPITLNRIGFEGFDAYSEKVLDTIADSISKHIKGKKVMKDVGPLWATSKTRGIGGGYLKDNIVEVYKARYKSDTLFKTLAKDVKRAILYNRRGWNLTYTLDLSDKGFVIYGITKPQVEERAFDITGKRRVANKNICPGIDHASAFPVEVVVNSKGEDMRVEILKEMYRMKLYFADAGEWAFVRHFLMPGQIEDEIVSASYPCYPTESTPCADY